MNLQELLSQSIAAWEHLAGPTDVEVTSAVSDSRAATRGTAFVAIEGMTVDGHEYWRAAVDRGATLVVTHKGTAPADLPAGVAWIRVPDTEPALGLLAATLHGHPSRSLVVMAVTGTNGKTTVAWLLDQILQAAGATTGLLGTVEIRYGGVRRPSIFTTPLADELQSLLADMRDIGCSHVVLEASSHGLAMHRMAGVDVAVGGFTNLSRDHIDYHQSMEAYRDAKAALFQGFARAACFNLDDETGRAFCEAFAGPKRTVSVAGARDADLSVRELECTLEGSRVGLQGRGAALDVIELPLVGRHNVENALVALGMAELAGVPREVGLVALAGVSAAPGRLESVPGPRHVLVDYAHTPDALANVLEVLRPLTAGRLICVFGAGGDRDRGKRPQMGAVVARLADLPVVTSDNPRGEDPQAIIDAVVAGMPAEGARIVEADRRLAIERAVAQAGPEDLVLIAGKGHEPYQIVGTERLDFDDRLVAAEALARVLDVEEGDA